MEEEIKEFFGKQWNTTEVDTHVSNIIKNSLNVIDIGCGFNPYKPFCKNLIGVDIINEKADWIGDILDYDAQGIKFDVAICYGILHFNNYEWVKNRLEWVVNNISDDGEILIKVNPSQESQTPDVVWFENWNRGLAEHFAEIYSLEIWNWREWKNPSDDSLRYKFDYRKKGFGIKDNRPGYDLRLVD
mgnify:CR=1 FL=1